LTVNGSGLCTGIKTGVQLYNNALAFHSKEAENKFLSEFLEEVIRITKNERRKISSATHW
jgi:hypothetical protein